MTNLKTDSPLSRRIAASFLRFLRSVEPSPGLDSESLEVARDCIAEVFKIDSSTPCNQSNCDSLIDIFSSREAIAGCETDSAGISNGASTSSAKNSDVLEALLSLGQDTTREQYSNGKDELFGQFFGALEKIHYFNRMSDGNDEERRAAESPGQGSKDAVTEKSSGPQLLAQETEELENLLSLRQRKRKAVVDPWETLVINVSEGDTQPLSPNQGHHSSSPIPLLPNLNSKEARENIFKDLGSPMGVQLLTGLLSSEENAHLRGLCSTQKLFEGAARTLSGAQMLVSFVSDVAATAKSTERKILATRVLYDHVNTELSRVKEVHMSEIYAMQQRLDVTREELETSQTKCQRAKADANVACVRADTFRVHLDSYEVKAQKMADELIVLESKLQEAAAAREKSEEEWKTSFLASAEFKEAVTTKAFSYFESGFQKCQEQYEEARLFSIDRENFPDFDKAIASLPNEDAEE